MVMDAHTYTLEFTMVTHTHSSRYGFLAGTGMCTPKFTHGLPVLITRSNQGPSNLKQVLMILPCQFRKSCIDFPHGKQEKRDMYIGALKP